MCGRQLLKLKNRKKGGEQEVGAPVPPEQKSEEKYDMKMSLRNYLLKIWCPIFMSRSLEEYEKWWIKIHSSSVFIISRPFSAIRTVLKADYRIEMILASHCLLIIWKKAF